MPKLGLRPFSVIEEGAESYFGYNFTRIENVFDRLEDVVTGVTSVTGNASIQTGLATVDGCLAGFSTDPSAGAAFISCAPGAAGIITVRVLTNAFVLSITSVSIRWVAIGELVLS
jgi:hypothetical protein